MFQITNTQPLIIVDDISIHQLYFSVFYFILFASLFTKWQQERGKTMTRLKKWPVTGTELGIYWTVGGRVFEITTVKMKSVNNVEWPLRVIYNLGSE